jgi:hypothetical protein
VDPDFPSKRDAWIVTVIWFSITLQILAVAPLMFFLEGPLAIRIAFVAVLSAMGAFSLWITYGTGYTVTATEIRARSGPVRYRVPLANIESITPSGDPRSSPAVSLDRLRIAHRDADGRERALLVSPADKAGFLAAIAARCPQLQASGDRLVPRVS